MHNVIYKFYSFCVVLFNDCMVRYYFSLCFIAWIFSNDYISNGSFQLQLEHNGLHALPTLIKSKSKEI